MMEKKVDKINNYFEEQIAACARRGRELLAHERADEAAFEKIKSMSMTFFARCFPWQ